MSTTDIRALFDTYSKAWADHDPDAIIALHSADTTFWMHSGGTPVEGLHPVREAFAGIFKQWPHFGFEVYRVLIGEDHWVLDWALTSVRTDRAGNRHPIRFDCVDIVTVDSDGLVARKDTFFDAAQLTQSVAPLTAKAS
ncbi:nuclear transport factor 2 family protein [Nocardia sp. NPDC051030]|uniref:nuclear transport factor 2 family protein n=1 Tax=Nocardia sp. NPDC051030 TaxID=3155162 RepID=UPI003431675A